MIYLILIIALITRLILINQSFWLDEAASLSLARLPVSQLFSAISNDFHPPLYYLMLHFWLKIGILSEWFLRLPNVIFAVFSVWIFYKLLTLIKTKTTTDLPFIGALLLSLNPLYIYYSQELRMYSLNILLSLLSWYFIIKKNKSGFILSTVLNLYCFYGAFFNLAAQLVYLFLYQRNLFRRCLLLTVFCLLFFLPWLPTLRTQLLGGSYLQTHLPGWSRLSGMLDLKTLLLIPLKFSLGRLNLSTGTVYLLVAGVTSLYFFSLILSSLKNKLSRLFILWLSVPLLLAVLVSFSTPILGYWRYLYLLPPFSGLIALGICRFPSTLKKLNLAAVIITLLLANLFFWMSPGSWREDWRGALKFASGFDQNQTVSIFAFSDAFAPVFWYSPQLNYAAPLSDLSSDPVLLDLNLSQAVVYKSRVIYFNYLSPLTDPSANIAAWLDNAGFKLEQTRDFSGVGFLYLYSAPQSN